MRRVLNDRYHIIELLGHGTCGETYLAEDHHLPSHPRCAVKKFKPDPETSPEERVIIFEGFIREAKVLEELGDSIPGIPRLYASFPDEDEYYLVQEFIEGKTLKEEVKEKSVFDEEAIIGFLLEFLDILAKVHARGKIHRDIKPGNIMRRASDGALVLIDFGAVKEVMTIHQSEDGTITDATEIGTPGYQAPEVAYGKLKKISDLFSLGRTLVFLLTGQKPVHSIDEETGEVDPGRLEKPISPQLLAIINKSMRRSPKDRFQSAIDMKEAVIKLSQESFQNSTVKLSETYDQSARIDHLYREHAEINAELNNRLGHCLWKLRMFDDAKNAFEQAVRLASDVSEYHKDYGDVLYHYGYYTRAEKEYLSAVSLYPISAEYFSKLGDSLRRQGKKSEAKKWYSRAAEVDPKNYKARSWQGMLFSFLLNGVVGVVLPFIMLDVLSPIHSMWARDPFPHYWIYIFGSIFWIFILGSLPTIGIVKYRITEHYPCERRRYDRFAALFLVLGALFYIAYVLGTFRFY